MSARVILFLVPTFLLGCVHEQLSCAEAPPDPTCLPWICCTDPSFDGCNPDDVAAYCETDGGTVADGGLCLETCEGSTPVCDATETPGQCVQCTESDSSACAGPTALCDASSNTCVACLADRDCPDATSPICDAGSCRGCTADAECLDETDTPVCDETTGQCVECTADTESARCDGTTCSRLTMTCTETSVGQQFNCEPCEADSDCMPGRRCVQHVFMGVETGYFCFLDASADGCAFETPELQPYSTRMALRSIDGVDGTYCLPPPSTTCQGIRDALSVVCTSSDDCGFEGLEDGYCPPAVSGARFCSYACSLGVDCREGLTCGGDAPRRCRRAR